MEIILLRVLLPIIGACMGSFLCCQARRLHHNLTHKTKIKSHRSICLHCRKPLRWYDNIPIISWLVLKGKCRRCHHKIGSAELLSELGSAVAFLLLSFTIDSFTLIPLEWSAFITVLVFTSILIFLAIYDGLYGELPTYFLVVSVIIGIIFFILKYLSLYSLEHFAISPITDVLLSTLILGGLYLALCLISKGKWVGDGDWLLATAIAIVLGHPFLAFVELFLANFTACLVTLPVAKGNPKTKIHFAPFLVIAFVITFTFSSQILSFI